MIPRKPLIIAVIGMVLLEMGYWYSCYRSHQEPLLSQVASPPVIDSSEDLAPPTELELDAPVLAESELVKEVKPVAEPVTESVIKATVPVDKPVKKVTPPAPRPAKKTFVKKAKPVGIPQGVVSTKRPVTIEAYINQAWGHVASGQKPVGNSEANWNKALDAVNRLFQEHPEWGRAAEDQNKIAARAKEKFPLKDQENLTASDVEPIFKQYGMLYNVGTAEFIRIMAYDNLQRFAQQRNDKRRWAELHWKKIEAAERLTSKYYFAQAFDQQGWMWQPVLSLSEYIDLADIPSSTYTVANANN